MGISMRCGQCGRRLQAPDHFAGRRIKCPACGCRQIVGGDNPSPPKPPTHPMSIQATQPLPRAALTPPLLRQAENSRIYREVDNMGTRQDTLGKADAYWNARQLKSYKEPYLLYSFPSEQTAKAALLGVSCIQVAQDTGQLICTSTLTFGYYANDQGKFEAILAGKGLTPEIFAQAREQFRKHQGQPQGTGELAPEAPTIAVAGMQSPDVASVTRVREYTQANALGRLCTYRVFRAPNELSAKAFLTQNPVNQPLVYLIVETPQGNWGRDKDGIYQE